MLIRDSGIHGLVIFKQPQFWLVMKNIIGGIMKFNRLMSTAFAASITLFSSVSWTQEDIPLENWGSGSLRRVGL